MARARGASCAAMIKVAKVSAIGGFFHRRSNGGAGISVHAFANANCLALTVACERLQSRPQPLDLSAERFNGFEGVRHVRMLAFCR